MKQATISAVRWGVGLGPRAQPATPSDVYASLTGPDEVRAKYPMIGPDVARAMRQRFIATQLDDREGRPGGAEAHLNERRAMSDLRRRILITVVARQLDGASPLRERLNMFWLDHFATRLGPLPQSVDVPPFIDHTLRSTMTGRFADMLRAVIVAPQMLLYLDQVGSIGPNSTVGRKQGRGLNENLARELLELHTLGVDGAYTQTDVRQMAELLTGLHFQPRKGGIAFRPRFAEPGAETVLGRSYGGGQRARLDDIFSALDDISVHPDTARHMAWKLAVHFVSDTPDPTLVDHVAARWRDTGGDLLAVYGALIEHPAAWAPLGGKVKQPIEFLVSSMRALGLRGADIIGMPKNTWREMIVRPLASMGQTFMMPPGPDGWREAAEAWITPVGLSGRIRWAMRSPSRLVETLPDPRALLQTALDDAASPGLSWAVGAADTVTQGVGLVLASPEFNRR